MAHHGEELANALYDVIDWSWLNDGGSHGTAPASVSVEAIVEGHPLEYVDSSSKLPAVVMMKPNWPLVTHYPKFVMETYEVQLYVIDEPPTTGFPEEAIRELAYNIRTNILAAADPTVEAYDLDYPLNLSYVEDVRWLGDFVRDEVQEWIEAMGLGLLSVRMDFQIQCHGTDR